MAIIDIPYVKAGGLGLAANDPALDAQLALWIAEAEARIIWECNQPIEQTTSAMTFSGKGGARKAFGRFPVTSVTSLERKSGFGSTAIWEAIPDTDYELVTDVGYLLYYPATFVKGVANYRMTFTHGYAADAIPADVKQVAREMVMKCYLDYMGQGGKANFGKLNISESFAGGAMTTTLKELTPEWRRILGAYAVLNVPSSAIG